MALFGESPSGIHIGFLFVNLGTLALLYFVARRWLDEAGVLVCCASYMLLSLSTKVLDCRPRDEPGDDLRAGRLVVAAAGARQSTRGLGRCFSAELLFGFSFLCKQPGLFFDFLRSPCWRGMRGKRARVNGECGPGIYWCFALGLMTPLALTCLILLAGGHVLRAFGFWTVTYATAHTDVVPAGHVLHQLATAGSAGVRALVVLDWHPPAGSGCLFQNDRRDFSCPRSCSSPSWRC